MQFEQVPIDPPADRGAEVRPGDRPGLPKPLRRFSSAQLFHGEAQVEIEHAGALYRLRVTSLGKLILTK